MLIYAIWPEVESTEAKQKPGKGKHNAAPTRERPLARLLRLIADRRAPYEGPLGGGASNLPEQDDRRQRDQNNIYQIDIIY